MFLVVIMPHLIANNLVGYQYAYVTSYVICLIIVDTHTHTHTHSHSHIYNFILVCSWI